MTHASSPCLLPSPHRAAFCFERCLEFEMQFVRIKLSLRLAIYMSDCSVPEVTVPSPSVGLLDMHRGEEGSEVGVIGGNVHR